MDNPAIDGRGFSHRTGAATSARMARAGIVVAFALLLVLSYTHNVNWDEFYFLSHVHAFLDGRLDRPMQTFFVHGFTWLTAVPGHEMEQIFAARLVMVGCLALTTYSVHRIARHVTDARFADIAALGFLTSGFVLAHGASFRADPIAAALLSSAIALLLTTRLSVWQMGAAALLSALAMLVTIKSALYLPAFLAVLIWRADDRAAALRILATGLLAIALCGVLYLWHASQIQTAQGKDTATNAKDALHTTLLRSGLLPRRQELIGWALFSLPQIVLAGIGLCAAGSARKTFVLVLFAAPLLSVVIYRNAFVYFFPFATPLLMVAVAIGAQRLGSPRRLSQLVAVMLAAFAFQAVHTLPDRADNQRAVIAEVHRLFPNPVPYIDDSHMIASFPNPGFFMSGWGVAGYRAAGKPVFAKIIAQHRPPLLIADKTTLMQTMAPRQPTTGAAPILLPEDDAILRATYVHYAGPIWLAGGQVTLTGAPTRLSLPFPGTYRLSSETPVQIGSDTIPPGAAVEMGAAPVDITGPKGATATFIWNTGVPPVAPDSLDPEVFVGFRMVQL